MDLLWSILGGILSSLLPALVKVWHQEMERPDEKVIDSSAPADLKRRLRDKLRAHKASHLHPNG